ncbi:MAG: PP2C family protein-serine/threonine phosphatase [Eubacterium sp.]|nr:PP2C family protein-serine/threonine phosphatase [Eubacterium sp.]
MAKEKSREKRVVSLRTKTLTLVLLASIILSLVAVLISGITYGSTMYKHYKDLAEQLADTAAYQLSADDIVRYYNEVKKIGEFDEEKYESDKLYRTEYDKKAEALKDEKYNKMLNTLFIFADQSQKRIEIKYIYVQVLEGNNVTYIFDADHNDSYQLGTVQPVSKEILGRKNLENGIEAFINHTKDDGWLCSCMRPVKDANGKSVALVGVDIQVNKVVENVAIYLAILTGVTTVAVALIILIVLKRTNKSVVEPINMLSAATRSFVDDQSESQKDTSAISKLNIKTGDEIEVLSNSIKQMELDIIDYITNLTAITAEKERIGAELDVATHIQSSMLPSIFPAFSDKREFDIHASMVPAKEVGGDFYDFFMVDKHHLAIVMADVSGKGVPAALFMVIGKTLIKDHTSPDTDLGTVFTEVNNILCESNSEGLFITAFECVLDLVTGEFRYANAGHEVPIIARSGGIFEAFKIKPGFVLAGMEDIPYKSGVMTLEPGDKLFQYTDGVTEATNANKELYGMDRLEKALNKVIDESPENILAYVKEDIDAFVGDAPQFDDITMLCLNFKNYMNDEEAE